jgi:hypothetical protein
MPTRERRAKERVREAIQAYAYEIAEHVANSEMISVERGDEGGVKFSRRIDDMYCNCGLPMIPMPHFQARFGALPCWVCGVCSIETIIEFSGRLQQEAILRAARQAAA